MSNQVNFGRVSKEYSKYRDELPEVIFEQFRHRNIEFSGKAVADLGAGSGIFCRALARQGASVTGIEPEISLISAAKAQDEAEGHSIHYIHSVAESIDLPDRSLDAVTALRAWHWFDRRSVLKEVRRLLKRNGLLIVINSVFVPQLSDVAQQTFRIVKQFGVEIKPAGAMGEVKERRNGFPVNWFREWEESGLKLMAEWQYDYDLSFTVEEWCGKMRTLSWMTNVEDERKERIIARIEGELSPLPKPLSIPHQYSVAVMIMPS